MNKRQKVVFQSFGLPREDQMSGPNNDPTYLHNTMVFEMAANWPWVRWMMDRFNHQELKEVDPMERDWLNFIIQNKVDVEKYKKDSDAFIEEWFKNINN